MLFFIPSWYQEKRWSENEQSWYIRRMHTEFDDTVKQIQLFHRSARYPYLILNLAFSPNFRHFLHRQSVYHAPYWSLFDSVQEIRTKKARAFSVHDLTWPEGTEFIRTDFVLIAMLHGEKFAMVEYGEDGNPIRIEMYKDGKICRENIYDDRGFVSATIVYENERPLYQDYLMEDGVRKMRLYFSDGHVEFNGEYAYFLLQGSGQEKRVAFTSQIYDNLEQIIGEVFAAYVGTTNQEDIFCVAMHDLHTKLLLNILEKRKMILSVFQDRYRFEDHTELYEAIEKADYIIADSGEKVAEIENLFQHPLEKITDITPFDTRIDTGISQQLNVQNILLTVDGLPEDRFTEIIVQMAEYIGTNPRARICLFTREADYLRPRQLLEKTRQILQSYQYPSVWAAEMSSADTENDIDAADEEGDESGTARFYVGQCVEELAVSKCMKEQRVLVDLHDVPELYLQILAISLGLPQIAGTQNRFAEHGGNAWVLKQTAELPQALTFYLDGMENWNMAQVYSHKLGKKYTTSVLLDKWKEVIESIG